MITSNGQLQMPPGQPQLLPDNIMLAPQGMPGGMQVSMAGPPGQAPMMKASDGKPVPPGQQQMQGQPQLIAMPGGGMAYMHAGPQQFMQNGQIIFRAPGSDGQQQLMFSPSGPGAPHTIKYLPSLTIQFYCTVQKHFVYIFSLLYILYNRTGSVD